MDDFFITVEIKTLNSKFADVSIRLPGQLSGYELALRKLLSDRLLRGKISATVDIKSESTENEILYDEKLLSKFYHSYKDAAVKLGHQGSDFFTLALHAPGVQRTAEDEDIPDVSEALLKAFQQAIDSAISFRKQEGEELHNKLLAYQNNINDLLKQVDPLDRERIEKVQDRLRQGLANANLSVEVDENRFEQELIYYIEKLDINEEKVRLANHLSYFDEVMESDKPNGKKLGFLAQEMGREINTIGSKANSASLQRIVVEMKEELEKIKEQVLNVL